MIHKRASRKLAGLEREVGLARSNLDRDHDRSGLPPVDALRGSNPS